MCNKLSNGLKRAFRGNAPCQCPKKRSFCPKCVKGGDKSKRVYEGECANCRILLRSKHKWSVIKQCLTTHTAKTCPLKRCGYCGSKKHRATAREPCKKELNWCINCFARDHTTPNCPKPCYQCGGNHDLKATRACTKGRPRRTTVVGDHKFEVGTKVCASGGYECTYNYFGVVTAVRPDGTLLIKKCSSTKTQPNIAIQSGMQHALWDSDLGTFKFRVVSSTQARQIPQSMHRLYWYPLSEQEAQEGSWWNNCN